MAGKTKPPFRRSRKPYLRRSSQTAQFHQAESVVHRGLIGSGWKQLPRTERAFRYYARLQRVKEFVEEHYAERVSLELAANVAHLEKKYFSTYFRRKMGIPFHHWLASVRVEKAVQLLTDTDDSLTQIAATVGFGSLRTFERSFKRLANVTPFEFKKIVSPLNCKIPQFTKSVTSFTKLVAKFKIDVATGSLSYRKLTLSID